MEVFALKRPIRACLLFVLILLNGVCVADLFGDETEKEKSSGFTVLPGIWYTPETKLAGGGQVMYYFRSKDHKCKSRLSSIPMGLTITQKRQAAVEARPDLYLKGETYHLMGEVGYMRFPDQFYGIGNGTSDEMAEDYTPQMLRFGVVLQRKFLSHLNIGFQYRLEDTELKEVEVGGLLAIGDIPGSAGGLTSGSGVSINWDNRDNVFYTRKGGFYQISAMIFDDALGSDYNFKQLNLDCRQFFSPFSEQTLALQAHANLIDGDAPFRSLSQIGGENLLRGYLIGRFRDKQMLVFQMEYRLLPIWWNFGIVGFVGGGQVADEIEDFTLNDFKYSVGGGLRYQVNREEGINLKVDVGYGKESSGLYIGIGEAF